MACNCSLVQTSINPQQISKQSRTLPSFYYHIKYSHCVWKNIGHFDLGLGFERGQGQKHKAKAKILKAKARSLKAKAKARKFGLEAKAKAKA